MSQEKPPSAVLSEHLEERMKGRRLRSALFLTFKFDPAFFEQEILPVLLDVPLSHAEELRIVQLEEARKQVKGEIAVYYDANGLVANGVSAKLDVRRVPIQHSTGIFHPKNAFLLVEPEEPDEDGRRPLALLVATMSANLTRAGYWSNVEVCHVEELVEGDRSLLRDDLGDFLRALRKRVGADDHAALKEILAFLGTTERRVHKSVDGELLPHFYGGGEAVPDFLERVAGDRIRGTYLEILSPYFDDQDDSAPLEELLERFEPRETRLLLPRGLAGAASVREKLYDSVAALGVSWGALPKELLRLGRSEEAGERIVHAKVYRFFTQKPKRELLFVGSVNLTTAAHQRGGNVETGILIDQVPDRRPDFWLAPLGKKPAKFQAKTEDDGAASTGGSPLNLRFHWDTQLAEAFWDAKEASGALSLSTPHGDALPGLAPLPARSWVKLDAAFAARLAELLPRTSFVNVTGGAAPGLLLVQEEAMSHKPSLLLQLSAADILRYWSLLTAEQRAAFLEARAPELALTGAGADLVARSKLEPGDDTFFDRFAGFFHAFGCLERAVREAVREGNERQARYRLFGKKYDSLGSLLDRVLGPGSELDPVDRYVIVLCAKQLVRELGRDCAELFEANRDDARALRAQLDGVTAIRETLASTEADMPAFLDWFDEWFLRRARVVEAA